MAARFTQYSKDDDHAEILAEVCEENNLNIDDVKKAADDTMRSFFSSLSDANKGRKTKCKEAILILFRDKQELSAREVIGKLTSLGFTNKNMIYEARTELGIESVRPDGKSIWRVSKARMILSPD